MRLLPTVQALAIIGVFTPGSSAWSADPRHQADVANRGAQVMPFTLSETTHIFTKTPSGGLQQVIAKDPQNAEQIRLIRVHLGEIANPGMWGPWMSVVLGSHGSLIGDGR